MARGQIFSADDARWTDNFQFLLAGAHPRLQKRIRGNSTKNVTRSTVARGQLFSADDAQWTDNLQILLLAHNPASKTDPREFHKTSQAPQWPRVSACECRIVRLQMSILTYLEDTKIEPTHFDARGYRYIRCQ